MSRQANGAPQMDNIVPGGPAVVGGPVVSGFPRRPASVAGGRYSSQPQLCSSTEQLDMFPDTGTDPSQILYSSHMNLVTSFTSFSILYY